jgi:hypothetical protein
MMQTETGDFSQLMNSWNETKWQSNVQSGLRYQL